MFVERNVSYIKLNGFDLVYYYSTFVKISGKKTVANNVIDRPIFIKLRCTGDPLIPSHLSTKHIAIDSTKVAFIQTYEALQLHHC
jgi:hypothetical protein